MVATDGQGWIRDVDMKSVSRAKCTDGVGNGQPSIGRDPIPSVSQLLQLKCFACELTKARSAASSKVVTVASRAV